MVRDEGSWLDIGTSISHFCIASLLCAFVAGLEFLSEVFVSGVEFGLEVEKVKGEEEAAMRRDTEERIQNGAAIGILPGNPDQDEAAQISSPVKGGKEENRGRKIM